jgi:hypothetical protein
MGMLNKRLMTVGLSGGVLATVVLAARFGAQAPPAVGWPTHGGDPMHHAASATASQALDRILWSKPMDLAPQYSGDDLLAHYGSPVVTASDTVIIPVKTGATDGFRVEARDGATGKKIWQTKSTYQVPPHGWFPSFGPTLYGKNSVAWPSVAGGVARRVDGDSATSAREDVLFYGKANYAKDKAAYDANVKITSPLVGDAEGNIYFTYRVYGPTPLGLKSGIVRIKPNGKAIATTFAAATNDPAFDTPKLNCAPAVGRGTLYVPVRKAGSSEGVLIGVDALTLRPKFKTKLLDPKTGDNMFVDEDGTSCPTIAPDGDVYFGALESPFGHHGYRGWLLHFSGNLMVQKTPGAFGWDDTPSIVPSRIVPAYTGASTYLILCKYNKYVQGGGDGDNKIALLDPLSGQLETSSGVHVMAEVLTVLGPTPDQNYIADHPNAVREWCVNTAAIDVPGKCAILNSEDGHVYRWNFSTGDLADGLKLTDGLGQAYTSTLIGPKGEVFAIGNATLFAIGKK